MFGSGLRITRLTLAVSVQSVVKLHCFYFQCCNANEHKCLNRTAVVMKAQMVLHCSLFACVMHWETAVYSLTHLRLVTFHQNKTLSSVRLLLTLKWPAWVKERPVNDIMHENKADHLKGTVHPNMINLSSFTPPNRSSFFSSVLLSIQWKSMVPKWWPKLFTIILQNIIFFILQKNIQFGTFSSLGDLSL